MLRTRDGLKHYSVLGLAQTPLQVPQGVRAEFRCRQGLELKSRLCLVIALGGKVTGPLKLFLPL